ncbi:MULTISPECIES: DUF2933 domain-containing protein [Streptomyces]|uniref:DUF2933 domain-containing protein n=1 Tax=Streptomyces TaxID=1883 RepID=UPI001106D3B5|nr:MULTISPECIES: DUF2933 domain-containing protein [Streptomyces]MCZ4102834.1 DUF2933 domain-containing protein [Streptomyces sp. H39-C1]MCZ4121769.1 DUF2933 domain-containing protein [Streptomyces sp. H39-S7]QNA76236.1 DUF2933 domain-containing protein [Streptomyces sp. So13.3]
MKNTRNYGLYAIAVAIAVVGALALGVPLGNLALPLIVLACPLMMFFMMRGMNSGDDIQRRGRGHNDAPKDRDLHDHKPFR